MITIRLATEADFEFFYALKSEASNIFWAGHSSAPDREGLKAFFSSAVAHQAEPGARKIYMVMEDETPVGHLYIIPSAVPGEYDLPIAISEKHGGKGIAKKAIGLGLEEGKRLGYTKMVGSIREDNVASLRAYGACEVEVTDQFELVYIPLLQKEVKMFIVEKVL